MNFAKIVSRALVLLKTEIREWPLIGVLFEQGNAIKIALSAGMNHLKRILASNSLTTWMAALYFYMLACGLPVK